MTPQQVVVDEVMLSACADVDQAWLMDRSTCRMSMAAMYLASLSAVAGPGGRTMMFFRCSSRRITSCTDVDRTPAAAPAATAHSRRQGCAVKSVAFPTRATHPTPSDM